MVSFQGFDYIARCVQIERLPAPRVATADAVAFGVRGQSENHSHGDLGWLPDTITERDVESAGSGWSARGGDFHSLATFRRA